MANIGLALKWHGGKVNLAKRIVALMPSRCRTPNAPAAEPGWLHYVEPFSGGLAVLLANNPEGISELVNDIHGDLINFWRVLQHTEQFPEFVRAVQATPFAESEWQRAQEGLSIYTSAVGRAWAFFVCCRQSLAGRMDTFAPLTRNRTRRGMNEQASAWLNAVEGLPAVHRRLYRVAILNRSAMDVIRGQDGPRTLFYCDPPYLHETRTAPDVYAHEMSEADHAALLEVLLGCQGKVILSGYPSALYDRLLADWKRHTFNLPNNAASGAKKKRKTEVLWCNF